VLPRHQCLYRVASSTASGLTSSTNRPCVRAACHPRPPSRRREAGGKVASRSRRRRVAKPRPRALFWKATGFHVPTRPNPGDATEEHAIIPGRRVPCALSSCSRSRTIRRRFLRNSVPRRHGRQRRRWSAAQAMCNAICRPACPDFYTARTAERVALSASMLLGRELQRSGEHVLPRSSSPLVAVRKKEDSFSTPQASTRMHVSIDP
jgi:hypothetical protein